MSLIAHIEKGCWHPSRVNKKLRCSNSNGLKTQRDAWCYNSSKAELANNIRKLIDFYNQQRTGFQKELKTDQTINVKTFLSYDANKISWTSALEADVEKNKSHVFNSNGTVLSVYRPFFKQYLYFSRALNERVYQIPKLFPNPSVANLVICISGLGGTKENTSFITNCIPDLNCLDAGTQCFPLYYYEERQKQSPTMFDAAGESEYIRRDGVSDFILERAQKQYGKTVSKEDIFYYVYGFLHSPEYRTLFANDLKKMLPRLPLVEDVRDFWKFSKEGRALVELHINYETVPAYKGVTVTGAESGLWKVEKMRFPKKDQKDTIIYNSKITISNIPAKAYEYVVNGKSAIEWIMERYQITTHKESNITNNPNDWAEEVGKPRYILDLLLSIINVSVQAVAIVESLPKIKFE